MDAQVNFKAQEQAVEGFVSALQELKAMMKSLNDTPVVQLTALDKMLKSGVEAANAMKTVQSQMVKNLKATNKEMQAEVEKSASELVKAQARAMEEGAKRTEGAWRGELAMVNRMYDLKSKAQAKALKELADAQAKAMTQAEAANLKAWSDDLKGFQQMLKLKVAAEKAAATATEKARADDLKGFQQMLKLKLAAEAAATKQSEVQTARAQAKALEEGAKRTETAWRNELAMVNRMYDLRARAQAKALKELADAQAKAATSAERANLKALSDDLKGFQQMMKLKVAAANSAAAELAAVNARVAASSARVQVNNAMAAPAGAYSSLAPGARFGTLVAPAPSVAPALTKYKSPAKELADGLDDMSNKSNKAGGPLKALTNHLTDVHSAARGVASGFGLMWLTWGRLTPLLAGAALSNSLVQTAQKGKEFETVLAGIEYMGGASAAEIKQLSSAALELGATTKYGPIEVAEGLKVLSLAGLNATESLQALKPTLDFATVSELPLDKATESILGISKAFGYTAAEVSVSGDVVAKAAAVSMSAVSDMTEAFKQSSTVAQQFGVTIQDQSTMLALLAQIGIRGSAAGTAVRNMYVELMGSSKKARKVLEETLNVNIFDNATKAVKPLSTVMADLAKALSGKTFEAQTKILNDLGNERGMKSIAAGLSAIQAEAVKSGKSLSEVTSVFAAMQKELEDAPGFMAIAAAGMAATTENIMKSVGGSLQSSMIKAFEEMSPYLINFSIALRDVFRSPEFIQGLKDMVRFVGDSAQALATGVKFVWEFRDAVLAAGVGLVAMKSATVAAGLAALGPAVRTVAAAFLIAGPAGFAAAAGTTALAGAMAVLKAALGPLSIALSAAAAAYYYLSDSAEDAAKKEKDATLSANDEIKKSLEAKSAMTSEAMNKEIERLQVYIKHKGDEKKISDEMKKLSDEASVASVNSTNQKLLDIANQEAATKLLEAATKRNLAAEVERATFLGYAYNGEYAARLRSEAEALEKQAKQVTALADLKVSARKYEQQQMSKLAKEAAAIANNNAANRRRPTTGDGTYNPDDGSARKERAAVLKTQLNGELQQIMQRYADEVSTIKAAEQNAQNLLKASHDAKLINSGEFYARELQLATESEAKQLALIEESSAAYAAQQIKDAETLQSRYASTIEKLNKNKDLTGEQREEAKVAATQALEAALIQMGDAAVTAWQKFNNDGKSIRDGAITRMELQAIKARGELRALNKASEDFWLAERIRQNDAASATAIEDALRYASPEQAAYIQATAAENSRLTAEMRKLQEQYELARESLNGYTNEMLNSEIITEQMKQGEVDRIAVLKELKKQMDELSGKSSGMVDAAGVSALTKLRKDDEAQLVKGVANAVETGLFEGGKAGKKKLRDLIVAELRKPVTLLINAVINPIMGALLGSMGLGSAVAGQAGGSLLGSAATSFGGSTLSTSIFGAGGVTGFATSVGEGVAASLAGSSGIPLASAGSTAFNIGAALPGVGAALLALNAFGVFRSKKIVGNGLMGTLGEGDIQSYDLQRKGGTLFSGPSYSFRNQQKSAWSDMIQADWRRATASVVGMAESLGLATDAADGFTATLGTDVLNYDDPGIRGIKLDDLRGQNLTEAQYAQAVQDRVNEAILTGSEQLAQKLIGSWETTTQTIAKKVQVVGLEGEVTWETVNETVTTTTYKVSEFARSNETALQTLTRLSTSLVLVNRHFANLGFTLKDKSLAGGDAASSFVDRFGGQENFDRVAGNYYQNYYSDAERQARGVQILNDEFKRIGVTMPRTTAGLRTMVDAAMAAGDEKLASDLLKVSEGFYAIQGRVEEQRRDLESQLLQAQGKTAELRALELAKLDPSNRALQQRIWALEDERDAIDKSLTALERAIEAEKRTVQKRLDAAKELEDTVKGVFDTLKQSIQDLRGETLTALSAAQGNQFLDNALSNARATGYLPEQEDLNDAITAARGGLAANNFTSASEQRLAQMRLLNNLTGLQDIAGEQLTAAQQARRDAERQIEQLDETLDYWRQQIEIANGTYVAVVSVGEAINNLAAKLNVPATPGGSTTGSGTGGGFSVGPGPSFGPGGPQGGAQYATAYDAQIAEIRAYQQQGSFAYTTNLGSYGTIVTGVNSQNDPETFDRLTAIRDYVSQALEQGQSAQDIANAAYAHEVSQRDIAAALGYHPDDVQKFFSDYGIPAFAVGTNYVPNDMLAFIHEGEAVVPKAYNPAAGGAVGGTNSDEVFALVAAHLAAIRAQNDQMLLHASATARATNEIVSQPLLVEVTT